MINIARSDKGPALLKRLGERQTRLDCAAYDACPSDYRSGAKTFTMRDYYSERAVKDLLVQAHHHKCCYCEKRFLRANLHIEHFRPKSGVRQGLEQVTDEVPGYYWLAYTWENLLLSCHDCNSRYKGTRFPLADPDSRARSHNDDIMRECPLFIEPVNQNPRDHIRFDNEDPKGISKQGIKTIEGIGLRRAQLREDRLEMLSHITARIVIIKAAAKYHDDAELRVKAIEAREFIEAAKKPEAEFSSMAIDFVARLGL